MDVWKYEQQTFPTEWEAIVFGLRGAPETRQDLWAVSIRGRVFTGFMTRRDAREYGKHIEAHGMAALPPAVSDIAYLPEALARAYRAVSRNAGYVYDAKRRAWVKALGDALTSGQYDDTIYPEAGDAARDSFEPEIGTLLEMIEEHMEDILANVRRVHEGPTSAPPKPWPPQGPLEPPLLRGSAPLPVIGTIEPFEHYPHPVRLGGIA